MLGCKRKFLFSVSLIALLSACAEAPKVATPVVVPPSLEGMLAKATADSSVGQSERAISQLKSATGLFPADKKPWLQMAQINFDRAHYSEAITNAQEVLQRDPTDKIANSIVAVSGLRLSTKALADLSEQNNLSGSVRAEAQDLAKLLRESLGESVLIPPVKKPVISQVRKTTRSIRPSGSTANPSEVAKHQSEQKNETVVNKLVAAEAKKPEGNPFGSLK